MSGAANLGGDGQPLAVGDIVDVPGQMHGSVKFIGSVKGKAGTFVGVELSKEYASRGKNDGNVDGTYYFNTSIPGSGIFLPLHRASKRASGTLNSDHLPPTPLTPGFGASERDGPDGSPKTPGKKFSQSVGPGRNSPGKTKRPSLPRPESPYKNKPNLAPTAGRKPSMPRPGGFSQSVGGAPPRFSPSPGPQRMAKPGLQSARKSPSRAGSRATNGHDEDAETESVVTSMSEVSRFASNNPAEQEVIRLQKSLDERDKQLREQASTLAEMESALQEIQNMLPTDMPPPIPEYEDADAQRLRMLLREKNEKIGVLTAEFDMHRADFRSTIDTLEMASSETVRVYEHRIEELMAELNELHERSEDVDSVAEQLKQLEELVQELEEGLEDARRGEAEARAEVEFLRGEVERGRSELRREREKAAAALKGAQAMDSSREVEQRDDEIRGLKAIIHSLSSGGDLQSPGLEKHASVHNEAEMAELRGQLERAEREKEELRGLIERKSFREEELERDLERMRTQSALTGEPPRVSLMSHDNSTPRGSESTVVSWRSQPRNKTQQNLQTNSHGSHNQSSTPRSQRTVAESMDGEDHPESSEGGASELFCEICETPGHDILSCHNESSADQPRSSSSANAQNRPRSNMHHNELHLTPSHESGEDLSNTVRGLNITKTSSPKPPASPAHAPAPGPAPEASLPDPYSTSLVAGSGQNAPDPDKWCALCERDGHDATACPFEDML
ncbi:hypothetical protein IWZ03DRAFT_357457 [Phyllosticta citriasiana]|uniref:CAP-Gly domain-containing protein n=1 Tax=Phyllosticta citriasiana TaxID=595635 RepID=A0ABR1KUR2_9PEZI